MADGSAALEQRLKQFVRRTIGEPYVGKRLKHRRMTRAIPQLGLVPTAVLDAGSEDATFSYWLADLFPDATVTAIDVDRAAIETCRATRPARYRERVEFEVAPSFAVLPDAAFDLVTAFDVLEHIDDDVTAVRELARVLRPGGVLLVHVPRDVWTTWSGEKVRVADDDAWRINAGHVRTGYSPTRLTALLEGAGLVVEDVDLWVRRWGVFAHHAYARLEHPRPLRLLSIPITDAASLLDRSRPPAEGNTVWAVARKP